MPKISQLTQKTPVSDADYLIVSDSSSGESRKVLISDLQEQKGKVTAWAVFDGTTGTILDSFNISSVTRDSAGLYTLNFDEAMDNTNYSIGGSAVGSNGSVSVHILCDRGNRQVSSCQVQTSLSNEALQDSSVVSVLIFGGKNL